MLKPCEGWNERLSAWLDGEGSTTERLVVEQHLAACPACRVAAEILRCDAQDVSAALSARTASDGFSARVMGEVAVTKMNEAEGKVSSVPRYRPGWLSRLSRGQSIALTGAAASVLLLIFVVATNWQSAGLQRDMPIRAQHAATPPAASEAAKKAMERRLSPAMEPLSPPTSGTTTPPVPKLPAGVSNEAYLPGATGESAPGSRTPSSPKPTIIPPELNYGLVDKLMIAYTAEMSLRTKTVNQAMERAELLFRKYDGFVLNTQYNRDEKGKATATVNGRVPAGKLGQLLVELDGLGELRARTVNGEDLTAKQLEQLERLDDLALKQQLLSKIEGRDNRYSVESQREAARQKGTGLRVEEYKLKNRVMLASVTVKISSPPKPKPDPVKRSASKSFRGLRAFGLWMLTVLIIPLGIWLPVWGPLAVLGIVLRRRYRR